MISASKSFRAFLQSLDALGKANSATTALLHALCASFVAMVAEMTNERVVIVIGQAVIARGSK